jgi:nitric oxide reductase large subunit
LTFQVAIRTHVTLVTRADTAYNDVVDLKQARLALIQFALWGVALVAIGGSIAASTWPHTDGVGRYSGDDTGFWFGVLIAWLGTLLLLVPVVAWGAKLSREAWPANRESVAAAPNP